MSKNGRWISRELKHLNDHMQMLHTDIKAGNKASGLANWGFAMGIVKGMEKRDKTSTRSIEKAGQIIKSLHKTLKPFIKEVVKESIKESAKAYGRKKARR